jgi:hypothetical protein
MAKVRCIALAFALLVAACGRSEEPLNVQDVGDPLYPTPTATITLQTPRPVRTTGGRSNAVVGVPKTAAPSPKSVPPPGASIGGCPLFPEDNAWRRNVAADPVDQRSDAYVASISEGASFLHPDFGSDPSYGIPYSVVGKSQKKVRVTFNEYGDESDKGGYPIPANAKVEAGGDRHVLVVQRDSCKLYELYHAEHKPSGWTAGSGAIFDLRSNTLRPPGWTSADAAGLPILPGLVRRDEASAGKIRHALRFTAPSTQRGYVDPARHFASSDTSPDLPPMGLRMRLKSSYDISSFTGHSRVILEALRTYGMILADNGSSWFISGANDAGWNDDDLEQLKSVPGSAFEAVRHGPVHD